MKYLKSSLMLILGLSAGLSAMASTKDAEKPVVGSVSTKGLSPQDYPKSASISSTQAAKIATDRIPGQILSIGLEREDGYLVYAVEVASTTSGLHEINVDAGNGKILSHEKKGNKSSESEESEDGDQD